MKNADTPFTRGVKRFGKAFVSVVKSVGSFFVRDSRKGLVGSIKSSFAETKSNISKYGFFYWLVNGLKRRSKVFGATALIVSLIVFSSVYAANAYAMNGVAVICNGERIGFVKSVEEFDESVRLVEERVSLGTNGAYKLGLDIRYEFTSVEDSEFSTTNGMIDSILRFSGTNIIDAYGLYVDGDLWAVCREQKTIDDVLGEIVKPYQDAQTEEGATVEFTQDTETVYGLYPVGLLSSKDELRTVLNDVNACKSYRIQTGDTIQSVAMVNNTTPESIYSLNEGLTDLIVGADINVVNNQSKLSVKTIIRRTYEKTIKYSTVKTKTKSLIIGSTKVEQRGKNGLERVTSDFVYVDGELSEEIIVESVTLAEVVNEEILVGSKLVSGSGGSSTGQYMRPLSGGVISSRYGYRGSEFHTGVDFAAPRGTPIMAADGGTVVAVNYYRTGFGYHVIIQHANGEQTIYGHTSAIYVAVGEKVDKGQVIAAVGATGRATGNHLHFEVRRNGKHVYPGFG